MITAQDIQRLWPDVSLKETQEAAEAVARYVGEDIRGEVEEDIILKAMPALPDIGAQEYRRQYLQEPQCEMT